MRKLVYVMENGTIETSMVSAQDMDMPYKVALESIPEKKPQLTEKQRAKRKAVK